MIYNDKIVKEYGGANIDLFGLSPVEYRPKPTKDDYSSGFITRFFAKKVNENKIFEIDPALAPFIEKKMYAVVNLNWKISGSKEKVVKNNIIDKTGVADSNDAEIQRVKATWDVDLSNKLLNRLEFWRGY